MGTYESMHLVLVLLDLLTLFDRVNQCILLHCSAGWGYLAQLQSGLHLTCRKFYVAVKNYVSFFAKWGVPQGSILDPVLFLFFFIIVPLGHMIYRPIYFDADDIKCACPSCLPTLQCFMDPPKVAFVIEKKNLNEVSYPKVKEKPYQVSAQHNLKQSVAKAHLVWSESNLISELHITINTIYKEFTLPWDGII